MKMRYIFIKTETLEKEMLILECYRCGYCEDLNQKAIEDSIQIVRPAKKVDFKKNETADLNVNIHRERDYEI